MISDITITITSEFVRTFAWFTIGIASGVLLVGIVDGRRAAKAAKARKARIDQAQTRF